MSKSKCIRNIEWEEFVLGDIFLIYSTSSGIDKNKLLLQQGVIPYITRSEKNNGIDFFINEQNKIFSIDSDNVITIGLDTQTVFYQPYNFYTGQNIQILSNTQLNYYNAQFLIPLIKKQLEKLNWGGNGATLTRLKRSKIVLPKTNLGEPDYDYMGLYMRQKEQTKLKQFLNYISKRLKELKNTKKVKPLAKKEWHEFEIGNLFVLQPGKSKGLNHLKRNKFGVNYLGATNNNNGVLCQVEKNIDLIQKGNCVAFIRNGEGSMGYSVYKSEDFIATSDITVGYSSFLNRDIGLFITTVADTIRGKYNFGYKRSEKRLRNEKILLPINTKGKPDYEYMENYIKKLEYEKLNKYLKINFPVLKVRI